MSTELLPVLIEVAQRFQAGNTSTQSINPSLQNLFWTTHFLLFVLLLFIALGHPRVCLHFAPPCCPSLSDCAFICASRKRKDQKLSAAKPRRVSTRPLALCDQRYAPFSEGWRLKRSGSTKHHPRGCSHRSPEPDSRPPSCSHQEKHQQ